VNGLGSVQSLFASELRRYRLVRRLTQEQLAERINYSAGLVSMIETLRRPPNRDFTTRCDEVLETGGALLRLWPLLTREAFRGVHAAMDGSFFVVELPNNDYVV
jgi:transcriptional regulator with XRE-family HTH domain